MPVDLPAPFRDTSGARSMHPLESAEFEKDLTNIIFYIGFLILWQLFVVVNGV